MIWIIQLRPGWGCLLRIMSSLWPKLFHFWLFAVFQGFSLEIATCGRRRSPRIFVEKADLVWYWQRKKQETADLRRKAFVGNRKGAQLNKIDAVSTGKFGPLHMHILIGSVRIDLWLETSPVPTFYLLKTAWLPIIRCKIAKTRHQVNGVGREGVKQFLTRF